MKTCNHAIIYSIIMHGVYILYTVYLEILVICPKSGQNALLVVFKFGSLLRYVYVIA